MDREVWSLEKIRDLFDLTGKVAIVTGGSGAFGQAAAKGLAAFGADVVITGRHADTLDTAAAEMPKRARGSSRSPATPPTPTRSRPWSRARSTSSATSTFW